MTMAVVEQPLVERLFNVSAFPPTTGTELLDELRNEVLGRRQAAFVSLALRLMGVGYQISEKADKGLNDFLKLPRHTRLALVADPAFSIWLQRAARVEATPKAPNDAATGDPFASFSEVFQRCLGRIENDGLGLANPVEVLRYEVDPLVADVAPPTYTFPDPDKARELDERTAYSLEIFTSIARAALLRIGGAWPELMVLFPSYARTIVHLPFADFRSASAARYTGVIFLTGDDRTILEVEESLVHEYGHQLLYAVMELDPIVVDGEQGDLTLPWSGAQRDFYGYFHALFVYTLLLRYLERIDDREPEEMARVRDLFGHILRGAVRALPDFDADTRFTARGRDLRDLLRNAVETRAKKYPDLVQGGDGDCAGDKGG